MLNSPSVTALALALGAAAPSAAGAAPSTAAPSITPSAASSEIRSSTRPATAGADTLPRSGTRADTIVLDSVSGPTRRVSRDSVRMTVPAGDIAGFRASVAAMDTAGGECVGYQRPDLPNGAREVALVFPGARNALRHVGIVVAQDGKLLSYNDSRRTTGNPRDGGPSTIVSISFDRGFGGAVNMADNHPQSFVRGSAQEAMAAASLGSPGRMIELVRRRCSAELAAR
jgi:hypothetical protein